MASRQLVFWGLLLVLATVQAAKPLDDAMKGQGFTLFSQMLEKLGITKDTSDKAHGTMFAPTDRAVRKFLADMSGMTFDELLARPQLVDLIVAYHFVPGVAVVNAAEAYKIISKDPKKPTIALTADVNYALRFLNTQTGLVTIKDVQGNVASVVTSKPEMVGKVAIWGISRVLMSGAYFEDADDAMSFFPEWSTAFELKSYVSAFANGPVADVFASGTPITYLMATNSALSGRASALAKMSDAALSNLMAYHMIPGIQAVPDGFKGVSKLDTMFKGRSLKVNLNMAAQEMNPLTKKMETVPAVTFTDERGNKAKIVLMNVYAGKAIIQGVDGLLVPNGVDVPTAKAASGGRKLQQRWGDGGGDGRMVANQWAAQNTADAIERAADGQIPPSYAARAGMWNAEAASVNCLNCLKWDGVY